MWAQMDGPHWMGLAILVMVALTPFIAARKYDTSLALATTISLLVTFLAQRLFGLVYWLGGPHMDPGMLLVTIPAIGWEPLELHRMLTSTWLHGDYFHILSNVIVIAMVGIPLELRLGSKRFILLYFIGGLGGSISWVLANPGDPTPALGASGAAFGLLGTYLACWPRDEIEFPFILIRRWPISMIALIYFALEVVRAYAVYGMGEWSNVGHVAHLGGFLICYIVSRPIARGGPTPLDIIDAGPTQGSIRDAMRAQTRSRLKPLDTDPWSQGRANIEPRLYNTLEKLRSAGDEIETRSAWMERLCALVRCPDCEGALEVDETRDGPVIHCLSDVCSFRWP